MDVVTGGRDCPTNFNKHTLQLYILYSIALQETLVVIHADDTQYFYFSYPL
jgi:hypothetical protein